MTTMFCAAFMQVALVLGGAETPPADQAASGSESYAAARRATEKTGKPIVVMVSTDWCQPCQQMKKKILPRIREHGLLRRVAFAMVNPDNDGELAEQITGGGPIPQLVMFRKTSKGWLRRKLVGGQTVEAVEDFIKEGLASDASEKRGGKSKNREAKAEDRSTQHAHDVASDKASQHG